MSLSDVADWAGHHPMAFMLLFSTAATAIVQAAAATYRRSPLRRLIRYWMTGRSEAECARVNIAYYQLRGAHERVRALRQIGHQPIGKE